MGKLEKRINDLENTIYCRPHLPRVESHEINKKESIEGELWSCLMMDQMKN
jgi:hypothetical protein